MKSFKVVELINSLNFREFERLELYINSGVHGKNLNFIKMYNFLKKLRKKRNFIFNGDTLAYSIFGKKVKDTKIRLLFSDFREIVEKYIIQRHIENNFEMYQNILLQEYRHRGITKNYVVLKNKLDSEQRKKNVLSIDDYYLRAQIESSSVMFKENRFKNQDTLPYTNTILNYDYFFILSKLHYDNLNTISKSPNLPGPESQIFLINEIVSHVELNADYFKKHHLMIYLEYLVYNMLRNYDSYDYHNSLLRYLKKYYQKFDKISLIHLFYIFNTYLINKINIKDEIIDHEKFYEIIKFFYSRKFFDEYGPIPGYLFYNCINAILKINQISFAEKFYHEYWQIVDAGAESDIVKLAFIQILMKKKHYESAIEMINKIKANNFQIYLNSRMFILVIYYEMQYTENALYTIDALKHYLKRHKILLGGWYFRFSKFIYYYNKLLLSDESKTSSKDILKVQILKDNEFAGREWLLSKLK
jgi:hypothetical protein